MGAWDGLRGRALARALFFALGFVLLLDGCRSRDHNDYALEVANAQPSVDSLPVLLKAQTRVYVGVDREALLAAAKDVLEAQGFVVNPIAMPAGILLGDFRAQPQDITANQIIFGLVVALPIAMLTGVKIKEGPGVGTHVPQAGYAAIVADVDSLAGTTRIQLWLTGFYGRVENPQPYTQFFINLSDKFGHQPRP